MSGSEKQERIVREVIKDKNIDICCIQECEVSYDFPKELLSFKNYNIEVENNTIKARCCVYLKDTIEYTRREDLEGIDNNIVKLELNNVIIVNIYIDHSLLKTI